MMSPIKINRTEESLYIQNGGGQKLAYVYFSDSLTRQQTMKRLSPEAAEMVAKIMARALRDAVER